MAVSAPVKLCEYASSASVTTSGAQASTGSAAVGSFLLAVMGGAANTANQQISDSNGHTWTTMTPVTLDSGALSTLRFAYAVVTSAIDTSDTFTFTRTGSNSLVAAVYALTGVDTTSPIVDSDSNSTTSSVTTLSTPALTSVAVGDATFAAVQMAVDKASSLGATGGWSGATLSDTRISTGTNPRFVGELYRLESSAGSVTPGASWTTGSTGSIASVALRGAAVAKTGTAAGSWAFVGAAWGVQPQVISNTAEGTSGVAVTTSNSAGPNQFDNVTTGVSTATYASSPSYKGSTSIAFTSASSSAVGSSVRLAHTGSITSYARFYYYSTTSGVTADIFDLSSSDTARVRVTGAGQAFEIRDSGGTLRATSTSTLPSGSWVRFEVDAVASNSGAGSMTVRYYASPSSTTPTETLSATSISTLGLGSVIFGATFGRIAPSGAGTIYLDELAVSPAVRPGPVAVPSQGTASGTFSFVGAATGKRPPKGAASGTFAFTGAAQGTRAPKATAAGTFAFTGAASGIKAPVGTAAGTFTFSGSAIGAAPIVGGKSGSASGETNWTGTATGTRAPKGSASGTFTFTGGAVGVAPPVDAATGAAVGQVIWVGAAVGRRVHEGSASGITEWQSAALGQLPKIGSGSGLTTYAGTATGKRVAKGAATGLATYAGTATGKRAPKGAAAGVVAWSGHAAGKKAVTGVAAGSTVWVGAATGISDSVVTPPERTYMVAADVRVLRVAAEKRLTTVAHESRVVEV